MKPDFEMEKLEIGRSSSYYGCFGPVPQILTGQDFSFIIKNPQREGWHCEVWKSR